MSIFWPKMVVTQKQFDEIRLPCPKFPFRYFVQLFIKVFKLDDTIAKSGQTEHFIPEQTEHMIPEMTEHLKPKLKHHNINSKQ